MDSGNPGGLGRHAMDDPWSYIIERLARMETKLDGITEKLTGHAERLADHETRLQKLERYVWLAVGAAGAAGGAISQFLPF